jgi:hypothetical protein
LQAAFLAFRHALEESPNAQKVANSEKEKRLSILGVVAAALVGVGIAGYWFLNRAAPVPFQNFTLTQVTKTGKARLAAISPDGKYVISLQNESGMHSLWLRNIATGSDTQIIQPNATQYRNLQFSPDANYIYFEPAAPRARTGRSTGSLCWVAVRR